MDWQVSCKWNEMLKRGLKFNYHLDLSVPMLAGCVDTPEDYKGRKRRIENRELSIPPITKKNVFLLSKFVFNLPVTSLLYTAISTLLSQRLLRSFSAI
jgi:hypothetical protein